MPDWFESPALFNGLAARSAVAAEQRRRRDVRRWASHLSACAIAEATCVPPRGGYGQWRTLLARVLDRRLAGL